MIKLKKYLKSIASIIIFTIILSGCDRVKTFLNEPKPSENFYTQSLQTSIKDNDIKNISIFYREFFKEFNIQTENYEDIINFITSIKNEDVITRPEDLPETSKYKVFITLNTCKYVVNVYNEKYVSIYSWDGEFSVDYVYISNIPLAYNIYGLCKYYTKE